jgi:lauroyl/myristoyl acyltransferase
VKSSASPDQPRFGQSYIEVEMFGRPTPLPHGVAALARAADVPLMPVFVVRLDRLRYRVIVRPPSRIARTADRDEDIADATQALAAATQALADEIAWAFTRFPHSWFCWWPRW